MSENEESVQNEVDTEDKHEENVDEKKNEESTKEAGDESGEQKGEEEGEVVKEEKNEDQISEENVETQPKKEKKGKKGKKGKKEKSEDNEIKDKGDIGEKPEENVEEKTEEKPVSKSKKDKKEKKGKKGKKSSEEDLELDDEKVEAEGTEITTEKETKKDKGKKKKGKKKEKVEETEKGEEEKAEKMEATQPVEENLEAKGEKKKKGGKGKKGTKEKKKGEITLEADTAKGPGETTEKQEEDKENIPGDTEDTLKSQTKGKKGKKTKKGKSTVENLEVKISKEAEKKIGMESSSSSSSEEEVFTRRKTQLRRATKSAKSKLKDIKNIIEKELEEEKKERKESAEIEDLKKSKKKRGRDAVKKSKAKLKKEDELESLTPELSLSELVGEALIEELLRRKEREKDNKDGRKKFKDLKEPKKKKEKKVKMTADMLEKIRKDQEAEEKVLAERERERLRIEKEILQEREQREIAEQALRMDHLESSYIAWYEIEEYNRNIEKKKKIEDEWKFYIKCGHLPNISNLVELTLYLHIWENGMEKITIEEFSKRTPDIVEIISVIDEILDTKEKYPSLNTENLIWVKQIYREQQRRSLDIATYRLLRDIDTNLNKVNLQISDFNFRDDFITFCLWLRVQLPIPLPNVRRPPKPRINMEYTNLKMEVLLPNDIEGEAEAFRAIYRKYDHFSDKSASFQSPEIPSFYKLDLLNYTRSEYKTKLKYKYDKRIKKKIVKRVEETEGNEEGKNENEEKTELETEEEEKSVDLGPDDDIPVVPFQILHPSASDFALAKDEAMHLEANRQLAMKVNDDELNLRKFCILGGIYSVDLLKQPPQPQTFVTMDMTMTALYLPKQLEYVPFFVEYVPPVPPEAGVIRTPEEIEEDLKKVEEEMEKLILVTLTWPQHVIFLELPMVCFWNDERQIWTKSNVHDLKHNEEKGILTFRTGNFGIFGLVTLRFVNLPYQAWEIKPEENDTVTLQLTAAILMLEFNIKGGLVCISQLQNSPNNVLQDQIGVYYKLHQLMRIMREAGIDIFPDFDTYRYVEGSCEKVWPMEKQVYLNMAQLHSVFNFSWSRWNITAGRKNIIFQMREFQKRTRLKNFSMVNITPLRASYVDCTEVSQSWSDMEVENSKFSADLYSLMKNTAHGAARYQIAQSSKEVSFVLGKLFCATRFLSFS